MEEKAEAETENGRMKETRKAQLGCLPGKGRVNQQGWKKRSILVGQEEVDGGEGRGGG